ncbi:MAG: AAA family ATPase [Spirochaetaceae bacterium]|jgi:hypothetical protein|nr:AAA family ATPase [Spirochaetaceae bacterium]
MKRQSNIVPPPFNGTTVVEYERCLLGGYLMGAAIGQDISTAVFCRRANALVFQAIARLMADGVTPDLLTLVDALRKSGTVDEAGGEAYIASLTNSVPTAANTSFYEAQVLAAYRARQTWKALTEAKTTLETRPDFEAAADEARAVLAGVTPRGPSGLSFVRVGDLPLRAPDWIVKGFLETDSFACLFGDPGAGKSFLAMELAACVATGTAFYGLPVKHRGPVLYLAGEGQSGLRRRFDAWRIVRQREIAAAPLFMNQGAISLNDPASLVALGSALGYMKEPPVLVVLDTWSRTLGGDDSAPKDAAAGVTALDSIRARFGNFTCLVVHHSGNMDKGRSRGWSGLRAAVDAEFCARRGSYGILRLESTKAKDAAPPEPMAFEFRTVELAIRDDAGYPVTSAVLNAVEWTPPPDAASGKAAGKNQALALDTLRRLEAEERAARGEGAKVTLDAWRDACKAAGLDRRRFSETKISLEASGEIIIELPFVSSGRKDVSESCPSRGYINIPPDRTDTVRRPKASETDNRTTSDNRTDTAPTTGELPLDPGIPPPIHNPEGEDEAPIW